MTFPDAADAPVPLAALSAAPLSTATLLDAPLGSLKMPLGSFIMPLGDTWAAAEPQQMPSPPSTTKQARMRRMAW